MPTSTASGRRGRHGLAPAEAVAGQVDLEGGHAEGGGQGEPGRRRPRSGPRAAAGRPGNQPCWPAQASAPRGERDEPGPDRPVEAPPPADEQRAGPPRPARRSPSTPPRGPVSKRSNDAADEVAAVGRADAGEHVPPGVGTDEVPRSTAGAARRRRATAPTPTASSRPTPLGRPATSDPTASASAVTRPSDDQNGRKDAASASDEPEDDDLAGHRPESPAWPRPRASRRCRSPAPEGGELAGAGQAEHDPGRDGVGDQRHPSAPGRGRCRARARRRRRRRRRAGPERADRPGQAPRPEDADRDERDGQDLADAARRRRRAASSTAPRRRAPAGAGPSAPSPACATSTSTRRSSSRADGELAELADRRQRARTRLRLPRTTRARTTSAADERRRGSSGPSARRRTGGPTGSWPPSRSSPVPIWPRRKAVSRALPRTWSSRTSWSGTLRVGDRLALGPDLAEAAQVPGPARRPRRAAWRGWPAASAYPPSTARQHRGLGQHPQQVERPSRRARCAAGAGPGGGAGRRRRGAGRGPRGGGPASTGRPAPGRRRRGPASTGRGPRRGVDAGVEAAEGVEQVGPDQRAAARARRTRRAPRRAAPGRARPARRRARGRRPCRPRRRPGAAAGRRPSRRAWGRRCRRWSGRPPRPASGPASGSRATSSWQSR